MNDPEDLMALLFDIDDPIETDVVSGPTGNLPSPYMGLGERAQTKAPVPMVVG